ncbi:hypothetical protein NDU88_001858 [Pleurodeles waltl]|uniref:Uncharacterized protein n=1 Tax=Pleurodeles waltl TaxID=8319 RepID=A0AAV7MKX4_PLEWA|nr:hypothetical protein NDU88_001858 [Pleurodeles waltl]
MDPRVRQVMQLLKEAGRLDLLVEAGARRKRPARQGASGVAAAVAACSPPRGSGSRRATQVRGLGVGKGRAGKASAPARRVVSSRVRRPGTLGARPRARVTKCGVGEGIGSDPPPVSRAGGMPARELRPFGERQAQGGLPKRAGQAKKAGMGVNALEVTLDAGGAEKERTSLRAGSSSFLVAETENGHMTRGTGGVKIGQDKRRLEEDGQ